MHHRRQGETDCLLQFFIFFSSVFFVLFRGNRESRARVSILCSVHASTQSTAQQIPGTAIICHSQNCLAWWRLSVVAEPLVQQAFGDTQRRVPDIPTNEKKRNNPQRFIHSYHCYMHWIAERMDERTNWTETYLCKVVCYFILLFFCAIRDVTACRGRAGCVGRSWRKLNGLKEQYSGIVVRFVEIGHSKEFLCTFNR